jgi:hypothetical protein
MEGLFDSSTNFASLQKEDEFTHIYKP